jgi:hypothetical protein
MISLETVKAKVLEKGYKFFETGDYNLNLVGLRRQPGIPNAFDDVMTVSYKIKDVWQFRTFWMTTDPGTYWLQNPSRVDGTAILIPGQYRSCWKLGLHQGKYEALVQNGQPFKVWRDGNKDNTLDYSGKVYSEVGGLNGHHAGTSSTQVDKWSAACMVLARLKDFEALMDLCHKQVAKGKGWDTFTYTLLEWPARDF